MNNLIIYIHGKGGSAAEAETTPGLASVFTNGYYALTALVGLVVGAGATFGVGTVFNKKKRKKNVPVEA